MSDRQPHSRALALTQADLIAFLFLDFLIGALMLLLIALLWSWVKEWNPSGKWGLVSEVAKVAILVVALFVAIILMAETYNFWFGEKS